MKPEHRQYVKDNMLLFTQSRSYTPEQLTKMFEILADVTNTPQKNIVSPTQKGSTRKSERNTRKTKYYSQEYIN